MPFNTASAASGGPAEISPGFKRFFKSIHPVTSPVVGEIYANVWHDNRIATIDPQSGHVKAWIDLTGLMPAGELQDPEAVLNGIAYDQASDRLIVTGKLWPRVFEIKVKR